MKRLLTVFAAATIPFLSGCDPLKIGKAADALDRFGATIDKTTEDGGNLDKRIKQLTTDMRKELVAAGEKLTEDMVIKFALARKETIQDIYDLTKKIFGDTRVLIREFQGAGLSIPLQLDDTFKYLPSDLKKEFSGLISATILVPPDAKGTPVNYRGVTLTLRPAGFQQVSFAIKEAAPLHLKIGDNLIAPDLGAKAGEVEYRIPIDASIRNAFDDTRDMLLPYQLVDVTKTNDKKEKIERRYDGFLRLTPRFPLDYKFKVFPASGKEEGEPRVIDMGEAVLTLVKSAQEKDLAAAKRHGEIYRVAKSRLAVGTSTVDLPEGAHWELTVTFPDGKVEVLNPDKRRRNNDAFGMVTVTGPNRKGNVWSLMIDVEVKK